MSEEGEEPASSPSGDDASSLQIDPVVRDLAQSFQDAKADARQVELAMLLAYGQTYQGPVPSPQHVREFNVESPGLGNQLVQDYLVQRQHDRKMEEFQSTLIQEDSERAERERRDRVHGFNKTYGFLTLLAGIATYFGVTGRVGLAALFFGPPLLSLVALTIQQVFGASRDGRSAAERRR